MLDEYNYEVNIKKIIKQAKLVKDVHNLVPNYLRQTKIS